MAKAPKRQRNYKAEYERRLAKGRTAGKSRQQSRGHKVKEHVSRADKTRRKYGVSPAQLTKLRAAARDRVVALFTVTAKKPVNTDTVERGMKLLHGDDLARIADDELDNVDLISAVKISEAYFDQLAEYFPASIDMIEDEGLNPLWYHR